jgi:hypothetical protein
MSYAVYTYQEDATPECHIYTGPAEGEFSEMPLTEEGAAKLKIEILKQHPNVSAMVLPLDTYVSAANSFVVKETGTYEGKPNTVQYYGESDGEGFPTRAGAEGAVKALSPGGGHEDMQDATFAILEVTPEELAKLPVEGLPE